MRVVLRGPSFLASLLGSMANAPLPGAPPRFDRLLGKGHAGNVRIGMSVDEVDVPHQDIFCEVENGVVTAIRVYSPRYKTEAGVGVGDRLSALASHYQVRRSDDNIAEVEDLGMKFQVREDRLVSILIC